MCWILVPISVEVGIQTFRESKVYCFNKITFFSINNLEIFFMTQIESKIQSILTKIGTCHNWLVFVHIHPLLLNGTTVEQVDQAKLLGVIIQSDLKWDANTHYINKKAAKRPHYIRSGTYNPRSDA